MSICKAARRAHRLLAVAGVALTLIAGDAAAVCGHGAAGFGRWLDEFKAKALTIGISPRVARAGLSGLSYDRRVVSLDRSQRSFKLSFRQFYARRVSRAMIRRGRRIMRSRAGLLARIERRFGVPPAVVVSIWGLETNYRPAGGGRRSILRSLATLAYDCRRSAFFQNELLHALKIIQRGDMTRSQLRGGWAGEIGPMQFLPSSYIAYAVDFDGDGRRNLMSSVPDMLASTANYLARKGGWRRRQGWGPGTANYNAIRTWNKAEVYVRTIAAMSKQLASRR